jgi:hypothetical protein
MGMNIILGIGLQANPVTLGPRNVFAEENNAVKKKAKYFALGQQEGCLGNLSGIGWTHGMFKGVKV